MLDTKRSDIDCKTKVLHEKKMELLKFQIEFMEKKIANEKKLYELKKSHIELMRQMHRLHSEELHQLSYVLMDDEL